MGASNGKCFYCQTPNCKKCKIKENSNEEICLSCSGNYWLNSTNLCQKICEEGEAWIHPNECEKCNPCSFCFNVTKECRREKIYIEILKIEPKYVEKIMRIKLIIKKDNYIFTDEDLENIMTDSKFSGTFT